MLKKYVRSGILPAGKLLGKYIMNSSLPYMSGQRALTESSSKGGMLTCLTLLIGKSSLVPLSTSLKKSLFLLNTKIKLAGNLHHIFGRQI